MSHDEEFEKAGAWFWTAAKALVALKNVGLLDAAVDAMKQQAKEFAAALNAADAQPADASEPTDA